MNKSLIGAPVVALIAAVAWYWTGGLANKGPVWATIP